MVESEILTERLSCKLAIVRRVMTFLEFGIPLSGTRWVQLVEIHWQSQRRVLRPLSPWATKLTKLRGRKIVIQALCDFFDLLEISKLTGPANPESISRYRHNTLEKQRRMSNKLAGFNPRTTTTNSYSSHDNLVVSTQLTI